MPTTKKHANDVHARIVSLTHRRGIRLRSRRSPFVPRAAPSLRALPSIESPINPPCTTILPTCTYPRQLVTVEPISPPRPSSPTPRRVASRRVASRRASSRSHPSIVTVFRRPRTSSCAQYHRARASHPSHVAPRASLSPRVSPRSSITAPRARVSRSPTDSRASPPDAHRRPSTTAVSRRGAARGRARGRAKRNETGCGCAIVSEIRRVDGRVWCYL